MYERLSELVIGISVSSRYFPSFVDYKERSGGLYPIIFDKKLRNLMRIAKKNITNEIPVFKKALWCVKEMHY